LKVQRQQTPAPSCSFFSAMAPVGGLYYCQDQQPQEFLYSASWLVPLTHVHAEVVIVETTAEVKITQKYHNPHGEGPHSIITHSPPSSISKRTSAPSLTSPASLEVTLEGGRIRTGNGSEMLTFFAHSRNKNVLVIGFHLHFHLTSLSLVQLFLFRLSTCSLLTSRLLFVSLRRRFRERELWESRRKRTRRRSSMTRLSAKEMERTSWSKVKGGTSPFFNVGQLASTNSPSYRLVCSQG